jgi:hypothetical protein
MPRFDSIARAAVTPGGFQAGVNDIVASIMNADAQKAKAAQEGQQIRASMAGEEGQMTRHREGLDVEKGRLGEQIRHNAAMEQRPGAAGNPLLDEQRGWDIDLAKANLDVFGNPEGTAWIDQTIPDPFGFNDPVVKKVKGPADAAKLTQRDELLKKLRAARASGGVQAAPSQPGRIVDTVTPKAGIAPVSPGAPATPVVGGPSASARQPLDFNALDAKLQASDPGYRQWRAGKPPEVWQKAIELEVQKGTLSP